MVSAIGFGFEVVIVHFLWGFVCLFVSDFTSHPFLEHLKQLAVQPLSTLLGTCSPLSFQ